MAIFPLVGLTLAALAVTACAVVGWRAMQTRAHRQAMMRRFEDAYDLAPEDGVGETLALCNPEGRIAIQPDGLRLHLGGPPERLRHVPWSRVKSVVPVAAGRFVVDVSRVGPIVIPGAVGRRLWEVSGSRATPTPHASVERARSARV
ncbi:MAG: hypothetical protein CMM84_01080 [Rhodothermaceae bacterium]|nr:hypothetical protein [Rhodothermaceae bacterium]MBC13507.1 hypothetical protein [Rhodothermaceae bacterium]